MAEIKGLVAELAKRSRERCEGRGDIGVRFDRLNELGGGEVEEMILLPISLSLVPEPVEGCRNMGRIILSVILSFTLHNILYSYVRTLSESSARH